VLHSVRALRYVHEPIVIMLSANRNCSLCTQRNYEHQELISGTLCHRPTVVGRSKRHRSTSGLDQLDLFTIKIPFLWTAGRPSATRQLKCGILRGNHAFVYMMLLFFGRKLSYFRFPQGSLTGTEAGMSILYSRDTLPLCRDEISPAGLADRARVSQTVPNLF